MNFDDENHRHKFAAFNSIIIATLQVLQMYYGSSLLTALLHTYTLSCTRTPLAGVLDAGATGKCRPPQMSAQSLYHTQISIETGSFQLNGRVLIENIGTHQGDDDQDSRL